MRSLEGKISLERVGAWEGIIAWEEQGPGREGRSREGTEGRSLGGEQKNKSLGVGGDSLTGAWKRHEYGTGQ